MRNRFSDIIKTLPCPFTVEATDKSNDEDVEKAAILADLIEWDWSHNGGNIRFFETYAMDYTNSLILKDEKTPHPTT